MCWEGNTYREEASSSGVYRAQLTEHGTWFKRREKYIDRVKESIISNLLTVVNSNTRKGYKVRKESLLWPAKATSKRKDYFSERQRYTAGHVTTLKQPLSSTPGESLQSLKKKKKKILACLPPRHQRFIKPKTRAWLMYLQ